MSNNFLCYVLVDFENCVHFKKEAYRLYDLKSDTYLNEEMGAIPFRAPEIGEESYYDEKIDIYALATSVLSILEKSSYWAKKNKHYKKRPRVEEENMGPNYWNEVTSSLGLTTPVKTILQLMLSTDPSKRPSAIELEKTIRVFLVHKVEPRKQQPKGASSVNPSFI